MKGDSQPRYYVPEQSKWPLIGATSLGFAAIGIVRIIQSSSHAWYFLFVGMLLLTYMICGWFKDVIDESMQGLYSPQLDKSFRMGMTWFIFTEIMFFVICFFALFYARHFAVPWLSQGATRDLLWPGFESSWPLLINPDPSLFPGPKSRMSLMLPMINTFILMLSSIFVTYAHKKVLLGCNKKAINYLIYTCVLATLFLLLQAYEYYHAYMDLELTLKSGIYGATFFFLTGFHGIHVLIGTIMLFTITIRMKKNHFSPNKHFAFNAAAWYWHFVDVVWVVLFVVVYWL